METDMGCLFPDRSGLLLGLFRLGSLVYGKASYLIVEVEGCRDVCWGMFCQSV